MKLELTMDLDNDCFRPHEHGVLDPDPEAVEKTLESFTHGIWNGLMSAEIMDLNGNRIGQWRISD